MIRKDELNNSVFKIVLIHIAFWGIYLAFQFFLETALEIKKILDLGRYAMLIVIFYFSFGMKTIYFKKKIKLLFGYSIVMIIFLFYLVLSLKNVYNSFQIKQMYFLEDFWPNMVDIINDFIAYGFLGLIYANLIHLERLNKEKLKKEIEKRQIETDYLKNQINQHFLYNTLNMLYTKSLSYPEILSEKIMILADSLRDHLKKTTNE